MATTTPNLGLIKPDGNDTADFSVFLNPNWDKIDDLAGPQRTTETVKGNADAIAAHAAQTVEGHKVHFGSANFAGPAGVTITHNLGHTNYKVMITPTADPGGFLGEVWVVKAANTIVVYNSGSATTSFDWQIAEVNP